MANEKSIDTIVLDAGPILQNHPSVSTLLSKSKSIVTSPSIVAEIKDRDARKRFETTLDPFVAIMTPSLLSIKFVTDVARKTGDLAVLSRADIEILALAYELEHAENDKEYQLSEISFQHVAQMMAHDAVAALRPSTVLPVPDPKPDLIEASRSVQAAPWALSQPLSPEIRVNRSEHTGRNGPMNRKREEVAPTALEEPLFELQKSLDSISVQTSSDERDPCSVSNYQNAPEAIPPTSDAEDYDSDSESSEGWITPGNIKRIQAAEKDTSNSKSSATTPIRTAIITTDFAMQNVILQIGLCLLSPSLNRISNIRTHILRCHACFLTVRDTSKQFCPRCGKPTLTRVSCSTNSKGEFRIHLKKNMQWNHRGDRYSIPKPIPGQSNGKIGKGKGGGKCGWGQELILAEDQKEYQRAVNMNRRLKGNDLMDENYLPGILTGNRGRPGGRPKIGAGRNVNSKKRV